MCHRRFLVVVAFAFPVTAARADETPEQARRAVWEFEMKLSPKSSDLDAKVNKEKEVLIREFFNGLKDREMKIAAIGMIERCAPIKNRRKRIIKLLEQAGGVRYRGAAAEAYRKALQVTSAYSLRPKPEKRRVAGVVQRRTMRGGPRARRPE